MTILLVFIIIASESLFYIQFTIYFSFSFVFLCIIYTINVFQSLVESPRKSPRNEARLKIVIDLSRLRRLSSVHIFFFFFNIEHSTKFLPWNNFVVASSSVERSTEEVKIRHSIHLTTTVAVLCFRRAEQSSNWNVKSFSSSLIHSVEKYFPFSFLLGNYSEDPREFLENFTENR